MVKQFPWQFNLRALLVFIAAAGIFFGIVRWDALFGWPIAIEFAVCVWLLTISRGKTWIGGILGFLPVLGYFLWEVRRTAVENDVQMFSLAGMWGCWMGLAIHAALRKQKHAIAFILGGCVWFVVVFCGGAFLWGLAHAD